MFFDILKRDLKRKKTMNTILLIFMILSVMFVSSSVNTMLSVMSATDKFFEISGVKDYFVATVGTKAEEELNNRLSALPCVDSIKSERIFYLTESSVKYNGKHIEVSSNGLLNSVDDISIKIFDDNKKELTQINDGEIYIKRSIMENNSIPVGGKITVKSGGYTGEFTVKGIMLDALFGSDMMGTPRFVISRNDFDKFVQSSADEKYDMYKGFVYNIETSDPDTVGNAVSDLSGVAFTGTKDMIKTTYILDMITAGIYLIVSVCLIIISIVLLRFTIGFTVSEEYREIGVMKAIGIKNSGIRTLYMVKYLAMALLGAVTGFFAGIPFGNMMTEQSSRNFVTGDNQSYLVNFLCALGVLLFIGLFTWWSTRKIRKFTPVDAIRSGESGKRYKKKGLLSLSKGHSRPVFFMAVNDILSGFRHFAVMSITFVIGILMITIMLNTISTLQSPKLLGWFSMAECDLALEDKENTEKYNSPNGQRLRTDYLKEMEKTLADNGIPAHCFAETLFKYPIQSGENKTVTLSFIGSNSTTDMYTYIEGTPPENANEIAVSHIIAERLKVNIGDTVTVKVGGEEKEFMISALYQSMNNMGEGLRFNEKLELDFSEALGYFSYQIKYTDNPSADEIQSRRETIETLYPDYTVRNASEYVDYSISGVSGMLSDTKNFVVIIVMLINILLVVLMEKSFITKERGEIALMKAIGFKNRSIILWQTLRVAIIMAAAVLIAVLLTDPASQLAVGGIFKIMGSKYIIFDTNIWEAYIIYPLAVFAVTVLASLMSELGIRSISSQEVNNIE